MNNNKSIFRCNGWMQLVSCSGKRWNCNVYSRVLARHVAHKVSYLLTNQTAGLAYKYLRGAICNLRVIYITLSMHWAVSIFLCIQWAKSKTGYSQHLAYAESMCKHYLFFTNPWYDSLISMSCLTCSSTYIVDIRRQIRKRSDVQTGSGHGHTNFRSVP